MPDIIATDKSNSMAGAIQVDANREEQLSDYLQFDFESERRGHGIQYLQWR